MELSIIITAHSEGLLAHKTILSVERALEDLTCNYEVIIHIDRGTPETIEYFERHQKQLGYKILKSDFGDAGRSRNYAVSVATGEYIIFLDADDLVSKNYFIEIFNTLKDTDENILVHPHYCLSFENRGVYCSLWKMHSSTNIENLELKMFTYNQWISSVGGCREIFVKHPYIATGSGFGHEDYNFNIETLAAGIQHIIAYGTMYFYRQKKESVLRVNNSVRRTQPYSDLFDFDRCRKLEVKELKVTQAPVLTPKMRIKRSLRNKYIWVRNRKVGNFILEPLAIAGKQVLGRPLLKKTPTILEQIPDTVRHEWSNIGDIETQLYPSKKWLNHLEFYDCSNENDAGRAYWNFCQNISESIDYVFIVPWVIKGGADKVLINYLKAFSELYPKRKVAVVTTLPSANPWKSKIPNNVVFIDFGNASKMLDDYSKEMLFTRTIIQMKAKYLHIINSQYAYDWVDTHRELIVNNLKINLSLFCYDIIPDTKGMGHFDYSDPYAVNIYDVVNHIYTDNSVLAKEWVKKNGFDKSRITVEYQPIKEITPQKRRKKQKNTSLRIVWASRICSQKNPEILAEIAKRLNKDECQIDVFGKFDSNYSEEVFGSFDNLRYIGEFNGVETLPLQKYDIFLYTSLVDGLPNMVLEVAGTGIPIIASNAGGVGDFIQDKRTGLLVNNPQDPDEYVKAIKYAMKHSDKMKQFAKGAVDLLHIQHSWEEYLKKIKEDFSFLA